jgi:ADP-ribose pyrophosphatase YjhB (NUDIX family)
VNFCSHCGAPVRQGVPAGDDRPRHICDQCGVIHYQNPKIIAGCIPVWENQVLLCRRAIEPRKGCWTLPAGFMEQGETLAQAASREAWEEANVRVQTSDLYTLFSLPHISQVYAFFLADMVENQFFPGAESLETRMFDEADIPWEEIAFETVFRTLTHFFVDRKSGSYRFHIEDIDRNAYRMAKQSDVLHTA